MSAYAKILLRSENDGVTIASDDRSRRAAAAQAPES